MANVAQVPIKQSYQPFKLSIIFTSSKLLEHLIHFLLAKYLTLHHPVSSGQWKFQCEISTVAILLTSTHGWLQQFEEGREVCAVFFDLRKVFDTGALLEKPKQPNFNPVLTR